MTPLEQIKKGIRQRNWTFVERGYKALTGEEITEEQEPGVLAVPGPAPKAKKTKKVQKKDPQPVAEPVVEQTPQRVDEYDLNQFRVQPNLEKRRVGENGEVQARKEPINLQKIKTVGNIFNDDLTLETGDLLIDRQIKRTVSPREREPAATRVYECEGCHRKFNVSPIHVTTGRYVCPHCIRNRALAKS